MTATKPPPSVEINLADQPDLDRDPDGTSTPPSSSIITESPYNQDQSRDATRQTITLWLLGLLCAIVVLIFVVIFARGASTSFRDKDYFIEMKQVLDLIAGPIITLLDSAVGFYFGSKQAENNSPAKTK